MRPLTPSQHARIAEADPPQTGDVVDSLLPRGADSTRPSLQSRTIEATSASHYGADEELHRRAVARLAGKSLAVELDIDDL
jgi:hypothetical protein